MIYSAVELFSIFLTNASIFLTIALLIVFFPGLRRTLGVSRKTWKASQYMLVGVWVSFFGALLDNSYWNVAWIASLKELSAKTWMFKYGVFANIPFRNIALIVSAYLHIKAAYIMFSIEGVERKHNMAEHLLVGSFVISTVMTSMIWFFL